MKNEVTLQEMSSGLNDRFQAVQRRVSETARKVSPNEDEYVHENPWTTVAIVAAAGLLLGFLIGNNRD